MRSRAPGCLQPLKAVRLPHRTCPRQVHEKLGPGLASLDPGLQVDVLWALCVLQQAREAELQAVLRPEFHRQFLGELWGSPPVQCVAITPPVAGAPLSAGKGMAPPGPAS